MDLKAVEDRFLSILRRLKKKDNDQIKRLHTFDFIKNITASESNMLKYFDSKIRDIRYVRNLIEGKVIIDAGCGTGLFSVVLSLVGAKKVYAVDYFPEDVEMANFIVNVANVNNVEVIHCDIGELDLPQKSIDGVFCMEAISHFRNYESFLDMASKGLREGGFLVINDDNNAASFHIRLKNYKIWDIFENHPEPTTILGKLKRLDTCFFDMRKDIIKNTFPNLNSDEIETFAKFTFAYSEEKVVTAVSQFIKGDFSLKSEYSYGKCPLDPETDCFIERLLNPKELKRKMRSYGFKCKIKSVGPARRDLRLFSYLWELASPITIFLPRPFQLIATKI